MWCGRRASNPHGARAPTRAFKARRSACCRHSRVGERWDGGGSGSRTRERLPACGVQSRCNRPLCQPTVEGRSSPVSGILLPAAAGDRHPSMPLPGLSASSVVKACSSCSGNSCGRRAVRSSAALSRLPYGVPTFLQGALPRRQSRPLRSMVTSGVQPHPR